MSSKETTPVIVSAVRTPVGRFLGGLSAVPATGLGAIAIREAMARAAVDPGAVDEVIMGMVVQGGAGQAPARQAAIQGGVPDEVPALTINKVCGSGLKAVMLASQAIRAGDAQCVVVGGMESMSQAPHYVYGMRSGVKYGNQQMVDAVQYDGLWCSFGDNVMGSYAEYTAEKAGITREEQDQYAFESHQKAVAAIEGGKFEEEIVPVEIAGRKGKVTVVKQDEGPRADTSVEALGKLRPAFQKDGSVTAGNAPGLNDAASALVVPGVTGRVLPGPVAVGTGDATFPLRFGAHARTLLWLDGTEARLATLEAGDAEWAGMAANEGVEKQLEVAVVVDALPGAVIGVVPEIVPVDRGCSESSWP